MLERSLIRVMVHEPEWRSRIAEQIADPSVLQQPDRELFEYLASQPGDVSGAEMLGHLDGEARMVLADLLGEPWGSLDVDAEVEGVINDITSRGPREELRSLQRRISVAPENEKVALMQQIDSLSRRVSKLKPGRWKVIRNREE